MVWFYIIIIAFGVGKRLLILSPRISRSARYVPLVSQSPYPIIVYFLTNYRPHFSHYLENVIFAIPT